MKKLLFAMISVAFIFAMTACNKKAENNATDANIHNEVVADSLQGDEPVPAGAEQKDEELTSSTSPKGLNITLADIPSDKMEFVGVTGTVYGPYSNQMMYDGMVFIQIDRLNKANEGESGIEAAIREIHADLDPRDMNIEKTDAVKRVSEPVYKVTYLTGHNEDTRTNTDYYIVGESFDFRVHTSCGVDFVDDYKDMLEKLPADIILDENYAEG